MIYDEDALKAAKTIQDYCAQISVTCEGCVFWDSNVCNPDTPLTSPADWILPEIQKGGNDE